MADLSIIGLVGHKGAGKDTAAKALSALGWRNLKFAGSLKEMLRAMLSIQGVPDHYIDRMIEGDLKEVASHYLGGRTPRHAMQTLGTEWGRKLLSPDLWTNAAMAEARQHARVVFTDCRFRNEAAAVSEAGGMVIRIDRPGNPVDLSHESEREIAEIGVHEEIVNDFPSAAEFEQHVYRLFRAALATGCP